MKSGRQVLLYKPDNIVFPFDFSMIQGAESVSSFNNGSLYTVAEPNGLGIRFVPFPSRLMRPSNVLVEFKWQLQEVEKIRSITLNLESFVGTENLVQNIELYDHVQRKFVVVDSQLASLKATMSSIRIEKNISRFVSPSNSQIRARIGWQLPRPVANASWFAKLNHFVWDVEQ